MNPATIVNVSPNPFTDTFIVSVEATCVEGASLNLYNVAGVAIQRSSIQLAPGLNRVEIQTEDSPSGLYYLHYKTAITGMFMVIRMMKE